MKRSKPTTIREPAQASPKSGRIHVCPFRAVAETVLQHNASRLLTCLNDDLLVETPKLIEPDNHLRLVMHDISEPLPEYDAPNEDHIAQIIDFALAWGGDAPMVVHCWAGISRSTAAAFTALCAINPEASEEMIARHLREASPTAYPNRLMVRLADEALGRNGRMMRAIEAIGRGVVASEAVPFSLAADHPRAKL
jgi:predicted protein tyrosine phosphatase